MYRLSNDFTRHRYTVTVVGCGGTGGFTAESLCRFLPEEATLVLVDHDRVEEAVKGMIHDSSWWVDAGNGENYGQVVIGNTDVASDLLPTGDI